MSVEAADSVLVIKSILRVCAFYLYGWVCEAEEVRDEAEMIKNGTVPDSYPSSWPLGKEGRRPPGLVEYNSQIERLVQRRRQKIKEDLRHAELGDYPQYPKEMVEGVLAFWSMQV